MEEWKDVEGYEGKYQISNECRVKSLNYHQQKIEKILKIYTNNKGYKYVVLNDKGSKTHFIHRLIAKAFIPNPNNLPCINHKDENPTNNSIENLEWCTYEYNNTYNNRHLKCAKKISESSKGKHHTEETKKKISDLIKKKFENGAVIWNKGLPSHKRKRVIQYNQNMQIVKVFESVRNASLETNFHIGGIIDCCKGRRQTFKGFIWKYDRETL